MRWRVETPAFSGYPPGRRIFSTSKADCAKPASRHGETDTIPFSAYGQIMVKPIPELDAAKIASVVRVEVQRTFASDGYQLSALSEM